MNISKMKYLLLFLATLLIACTETTSIDVGSQLQKTVLIFKTNLRYPNNQVLLDQSGVQIEIEGKVVQTEEDGAVQVDNISILTHHHISYSYRGQLLFEEDCAFDYSDTLLVKATVYLPSTSTANLTFYRDSLSSYFNNVLGVKGKIDIAANDCLFDEESKEYQVYALLFSADDASLEYDERGGIYELGLLTDSLGNAIKVNYYNHLNSNFRDYGHPNVYSEIEGKNLVMAIVGHCSNFHESFSNGERVEYGYKDQTFYTVFDEKSDITSYENIGPLTTVNIE